MADPGAARALSPDTSWDAATWEGARQATFEGALRATPAQRLAWLEEALALVREVRRAARQQAVDSLPASD